MSDDPKLLGPRGEELSTGAETQTERALERSREDDNYVPVIVKRTDESKVHPDDILERAILEGVEQIERPVISLLLSSVAAGLILGFSGMAVAVVATAVPSDASVMLGRIAMALVYPLGFVICIMSGTQLFTEHTATAVYPVLDRRSRLVDMLRLWGIVIAGNFVGTFLSSILILKTNIVIQAQAGYLEIAHHLVSYDFPSLLFSSVLAGLLMAQGGWLVLATPPQSSQLICIYFVTFLIGIGGLHHSIAGSAEIFTAWLMDHGIGLGDVGFFLGTAVLGNLIGGSLFVAVLNYGHIRHTNLRES